MTASFDLQIEAADGVRGLGRVVGVLALYDLTPVTLSLRGGREVLDIELQLEADPRNCELCVARLQALVSVVSAAIAPAAPAACEG